MIFVVCRFFSNLTFSKNSFRNLISVSNSLDPDQAQHYVGPDQDPKCLQMLSVDDTSRQSVNYLIIFSDISLFFQQTINQS